MTAKPAATSNRYKIPGLDGIRGLAVLSLFVFHADILPHFPGALATTVFFFLSGFLITTLFVREFKKTGTVDLVDFYKRRALRILPPLYLVLALALIANSIGHVGDHVVPWKVAGHFFQYTNFAMAFPRSLVGFLPGMLLLWSLAVDEHFYLLFAPFFKAGATKHSLQRLTSAVLVLCGVILAWRCFVYVHEGSASVRITVGSDTRMDSILWGAFLALWRNPALEPERAKSLAKPGYVLLGICGLLLPVVTKNDLLRGTVFYSLQGISLIPIFTAAILHGRLERKIERTPVHEIFDDLRGRPLDTPPQPQGMLEKLSRLHIGKILESPFLLWTSQISYPFYLFSGLTLDTLLHVGHGHAPRLAIILFGFGLTYGLATLMHLYLERPLMALRKSKKRTGTSSGEHSQVSGAAALSSN